MTGPILTDISALQRTSNGSDCRLAAKARMHRFLEAPLAPMNDCECPLLTNRICPSNHPSLCDQRCETVLGVSDEAVFEVIGVGSGLGREGTDRLVRNLEYRRQRTPLDNCAQPTSDVNHISTMNRSD